LKENGKIGPLSGQKLGPSNRWWGQEEVQQNHQLHHQVSWVFPPGKKKKFEGGK
jgi:hypothetical protein